MKHAPIPVVIMNLGHSALGAARALERLAPPILVTDSRTQAYGMRSRRFEVVHTVDPRDDASRYLEQLIGLAKRLGGPAVLFPTRDLDVVFINDHRAQLSPHYLIAQPEAHIVERIIDKHGLTMAAEQTGVATPRTVRLVNDPSQDFGIPEAMHYPAIIKAVHAHETRLDGRWQRAGGKKGFVVGDRQSAIREAARLLELGIDWYMQEFIPGPVENLLICGGYIGRSGALLGAYTARKILQIPEDAGLGSIVETLDRPDLVEATQKVLGAVGYSGLFEAEYKTDEQGTPRLIEINPRHWDQHELGTACGVNLSELAYLDVTGNTPQAVVSRYQPAQWVDDTVFVYLLSTGRFGRLFSIYRERFLGKPGMRALYSMADSQDKVVALDAYLEVFGGTLSGLWGKLRGR